MPLKVIGLALYGPLAASHRVRLAQYVHGLAEVGIDLKIQSLLSNAYLLSRLQQKSIPVLPILRNYLERLGLLLRQHRFDAAIIQCELFPFSPGWFDRNALRIPYIYDFDDAWYLRYKVGRFARLSPLLGDKFGPMLSQAAAITAGSRHLADYARAFNTKVTTLPSVVDTKKFIPLVSSEKSTFTIGWIGSPSTAEYLKDLVVPLQRLGQSGRLKLVVIGGKAPHIEGIEVVEHPWSEESEVQLINTFDVGVMPLPDNEWARGKCAFKLVQYMACGVPVVASRVGANVDLVTEDCGFLVSNANQWVDAIRWLWERPIVRQKMGESCRRRVERSYSLESNIPLLSDVIYKVVAEH